MSEAHAKRGGFGGRSAPDQPSARIVDVGGKDVTAREAAAEATIRMTPEACARVCEGTPKGNALEAARIAGLQAVKRTPDLLPFCHPVALTGAEVSVTPSAEEGRIVVRATVRAVDRTGVEMEALTAAAVGALCLYDATKAYDRAAVITDVRLVSKSGGRSGDYRA
jgi:cyclic pyranopterin phosphate synthase